MRAEGFRGIAGALDLDFDPSDGLTVVQAPNGTGKSSIADALRAALAGQPSREGRSLWAPVDRAAGAERAAVEARLVCGDDELVLRWDETGSSAVLREAREERRVCVTDPDWSSALDAYTPVYSYAQTRTAWGRTRTCTVTWRTCSLSARASLCSPVTSPSARPAQRPQPTGCTT